MTDIHPSSQTLEEFLRGELSRDRANEVVDHLLSDCFTCKEITGAGWSDLLSGLQATGLNHNQTTPLTGKLLQHPSYRTAVANAVTSALGEARQLEGKRDAANRAYSDLMIHPQVRRMTIVSSLNRFQSAELCELLTEKGYDQRFSDVQSGVELTELAVVVGQHLDIEAYGREEIGDIQGRAWAYHGNALRVASDLRRAEKAFREARQSFKNGRKSDQDKALMCRFKALLLRARQEFDQAHSLQDRAIVLYLRQGDTLCAANVITDQALGVLYRGEPEQAHRNLRRALRMYDELGDERGKVVARQNLALCLTQMGQPREALEQIAELRPQLQGLGDHVSLIRLRWLEGKILGELGFEQQAKEALVEARDGFGAEMVGFDAALVSLDLAMVLAKQGRASEVRLLAEEMLPIFRSRDIHREALTALILFREAALAETATLALIERVSHFLHRAQHDPKLKFKSS